MVRYVWMEEERDFFLQVIKEKNTLPILDCKQTRATIIPVRFDLYAVSWKHQKIAIVLNQNFKTM